MEPTTPILQCSSVEVMSKSCESKFRRRTSSHSLTLDVEKANHGDIQASKDPEPESVHEDVAEEGCQLFQNFVRDEIHRRGLREPQECFSPYCSTPLGYRNPVWAKTGKELRLLADEFSKTKERQKVQRKAEVMTINDGVTYDQFRDLLMELCIGDGLTQERILVLFFFCSDLAIRLLKDHALDFFRTCLSWSNRFIVEKICTWVQQHGGWAAVLSTSAEYISKLVVVASVAMLSYGMYKWICRKLS